MEVAGSSRPASGSEHLISHALDSISPVPRTHGLQVGAAAYLCALLQNNESGAVKKFLIETGFAGFIAKYPFDKESFLKAVKLAPKMKENYYTILSEKNSLAKAKHLIETDSLLKQMIR